MGIIKTEGMNLRPAETKQCLGLRLVQIHC